MQNTFIFFRCKKNMQENENIFRSRVASFVAIFLSCAPCEALGP